jgi:cytoskeleton protein RodZ
MIERASEFGASAAVPLVGGDSTNKTAGDMLREAREAHGLHLDVVAAALKVTPQKLAALEADDIGALPDPVFARALAASVCRALRIDPAPVLAKLPGAIRPGLADADQTMSKNLRSASPRSGPGGLPSRALLIVVGLLLVGAAVLFWTPQSAFDRVEASISRLTSHDTATEQTASAPKPAPATSGPVTPAVTPAGAPVAPPPPAEPAHAEPAVAAAPAAPVTDDLIVFTVREDTWISVTEPGGKQLLHRTVKAGESVGLSGKLPLAVTIGRAAGVQVQVHGKPFDLAPLTRSGGVARFDVKS